MKLTNTIKDRIFSNIMSDTFGERKKTLQDQKSRLADDVYANYYGPYLKKMSALPESFFVSKSKINIKSSVDRYCVELDMTKSRLFCSQYHYGDMTLEAGSDLEKRFVEIREIERSLSSDEKKLSHNIRSILNQVNTDKQLAEVWPESEKWIPQTQEARLNLPALRCDDLNDMIAEMKGAGQ